MSKQLLALLATISCTPSTDLAESSVVVISRVDAARVLAARPALVVAAGGPLAQSAALLASTDDGRSVLVVVAECALPADDSVVVGGFEYLGGLGLASHWRRRPPTAAERRWVTGCVMAHASGLQIAIPISLRGHHPRLRTSPDERTAYPLDEGAYWGDLFADAAPLLACRGADPTPDRVCSLPDPLDPLRTPCGFTFAGECDATCDHRRRTCGGRGEIVGVRTAE